jgi:hypothetical protein
VPSVTGAGTAGAGKEMMDFLGTWPFVCAIIATGITICCIIVTAKKTKTNLSGNIKGSKISLTHNSVDDKLETILTELRQCQKDVCRLLVFTPSVMLEERVRQYERLKDVYGGDVTVEEFFEVNIRPQLKKMYQHKRKRAVVE